MGSVYLAERADEVFSQKVAVKVLAANLSGDDFVERFRVERQLLAQMHHPNIVQVLDGGISESGEAYLVTEYVDGAPIDRFCDHRRLTVRERIQLFLQVCAAVEHAHQNLVVHRDLKPSNILVTLEQGVVKLLDFGTAKLLKDAEAATMTEVMLLTPQYASPEQLRKDAITTRADVYSLGMILFELLSGVRAFTGDGAVVHELARAYEYSKLRQLGDDLTEELAGRRNATVRDLGRELDGDLRVICAKALEHEPGRRYATVRDLIEDLDAYLDSRPVKARPATTLYKFRKFVYRQRIAVAAGVLVVAAVSGGVVGTLREKRLAERRFEDVRRLAHYQIFDLYDQLQEVQGTTKLRAGMSAEALRYLDALASEAKTDEKLAVEVALGYLRMGDVAGNFSLQSLGNWQEALTTYQKGLAMLGSFQSYNARRARAWLNYSQLSARLALQPSPDGAKEIGKVVYDFEALAREAPKDIENQLRLGKIYQAVARALQSKQYGDTSEPWTRQAQAAFEAGLALNPESKPLLVAMHQLTGERATWLSQGKPEEAMKWASEAERWLLRMPKEMREIPVVKRDRASNLSARAAAQLSLGLKTEALEEMKQAAALFATLASDPDNLAAQMDMISVTHNTGLLEYDLGLKDDYKRTSEKSLELAEGLLKRGPNPRAEEFRVRALYNLAYAYAETKDARTEELMKRAMAAIEARMKQLPKDTGSRVWMADLLLNLKYPGFDQTDRALAVAREIVELAPKELNGWELLAEAHLQLNQGMEAVTALEKGLACLPAPKTGEQPSALYDRMTKRIEAYRAKFSAARH